jgi:hypothetical protein
MNIRLLFILDGFDHIHQIFKDKFYYLQRLYELYDRPELRIDFSTTSRRTIRDIESAHERHSQARSVLAGIFQNYYLNIFSCSTMLYELLTGEPAYPSPDARHQTWRDFEQGLHQ